VKVAVFSRRTPEADPQCDRLGAGLAQAGHDVVFVDIAAFVRGSVSFDPAGGLAVVDDVALDPGGLDAVVLGPLPGAVAWTAPATTRLTAEEHMARARAHGERHALAWSVVLDWERRGVPMVSSPSLARPFDHKPFQLASLSRVVPVPRTLVTGDAGAARAFAELVVEAVVKPVTGGAARAFDPALVRGGLPLIVQERVRGHDVRAVVVGDEVVAVGAFDPAAVDAGGEADGNSLPLDVRERAAWKDGTGRYLPIDAGVIVDVARRAARACCFDFAAVDLKQRADGSVVVLEVNRTPLVCDLEDDLGAPITERFVSFVEQRAAMRPT
jgi:hypothetical protein